MRIPRNIRSCTIAIAARCALRLPARPWRSRRRRRRSSARRKNRRRCRRRTRAGRAWTPTPTADQPGRGRQGQRVRLDLRRHGYRRRRLRQQASRGVRRRDGDRIASRAMRQRRASTIATGASVGLDKDKDGRIELDRSGCDARRFGLRGDGRQRRRLCHRRRIPAHAKATQTADNDPKGSACAPQCRVAVSSSSSSLIENGTCRPCAPWLSIALRWRSAACPAPMVRHRLRRTLLCGGLRRRPCGISNAACGGGSPWGSPRECIGGCLRPIVERRPLSAVHGGCKTFVSLRCRRLNAVINGFARR